MRVSLDRLNLDHVVLLLWEYLWLSCRIRDVQHFKILRTEQRDQYYLWSNAPTFESINALVDYYKKNSVSKQETVMLRDSQLVCSNIMSHLTFHRSCFKTHRFVQILCLIWPFIDRAPRLATGLFKYYVSSGLSWIMLWDSNRFVQMLCLL